MSYTIIVSKPVQKQIDDLPSDIKDRLAEKIKTLVEEPRPDGVVKLKGSDREYRIGRVIIESAMRLMMRGRLYNSCSANIEEMFIDEGYEGSHPF